MNSERRVHARTTFQGNAYVSHDGRCRVAPVTDISPDGLFVQTRTDIDPGEDVKVFLPLHFRDGWRLCLFRGEVVRHDDGLGIALRNGDSDNRGLLVAFAAGFN